MKLEHIAISVSDSAEIKDFYQDLLGMSEVRTFILNKELADRIFGITQESLVFLMQKNNLILEIFMSSGKKNQNFNHICISVKDREILVEKAVDNSYECIRIERDKSDLIFIKDKSGNVFEIKEM